MIMGGACGTFSPKILNCFANIKEDYEKLASEGAGILAKTKKSVTNYKTV
jgi:hypothetical protein